MYLIPPWLRRLWNAWDVRVLALLSLSLQIILYIFGSRRKYMVSFWINTVVWVGYLMADWGATITLSKLSDVLQDPGYDKSNSGNAALHGLWAPLLLVHLGGPDTITAYSVEDNQLWPRHWISLFVQAAVALYAILLSWRVNFWISLLTFPALVIGITKCGERAWVLMLANRDENSNLVSGFHYKHGREACSGRSTSALHLAYCRLAELKPFMEQYDLNRDLYFRYRTGCERTSADGWELMELMECELGLIYDLLYTKASVIYTRTGFILRCISLVCTVSVTVGFIWFVIHKENWKDDYIIPIADIAVTGALVIGALVLETYATILSLSSDWTVTWTETMLDRPFRVFNERRWYNVMGQFNLREFCEEVEPLRSRWRKVIGRLMPELHKTHIPVARNTWEMIIKFIRSSRSADEVSARDLCGDLLGFGASEFAGGIAALHVITELFYKNELERLTEWHFAHLGFGTNIMRSEDDREIRETCRILSNYMMYLLLFRSSMIPGVGVEIIKEGIIQPPNHDGNIFSAIFVLGTRIGTPQRIVDSFGKMINDAAASSSTSSSSSPWVILTNAWLAILLYTAKKCNKKEHFQQLGRGGELLTILWCLSPQSWLYLGVDPRSLDAKLNIMVEPTIGTEGPLDQVLHLINPLPSPCDSC
ncbi:hypothetical protein NMG60_11009717 [Bertholletia excelsa]